MSRTVGRCTTGLEILHCESGKNRLLADRLVSSGVAIPLFDEQPLVFSFFELHQGPGASKFHSLQLEEEFPLLHSLSGVADRSPAPAVPHDHRSGTVIPLRDHSFKSPILERMILHQYRQPLVRGIEGRAFGNRPRPENSVDLQAEIVVQPSRSVLVHHEESTGRGARRWHWGAGRLRSLLERPLCPVRGEGI